MSGTVTKRKRKKKFSTGANSSRRQTVRPAKPSIAFDGDDGEDWASPAVNPKGKGGGRDRDRPAAERLTESATARLLEAKPPEGVSRQIRRQFERHQKKLRDAAARKEQGK